MFTLYWLSRSRNAVHLSSVLDDGTATAEDRITTYSTIWNSWSVRLEIQIIGQRLWLLYLPLLPHYNRRGSLVAPPFLLWNQNQNDSIRLWTPRGCMSPSVSICQNFSGDIYDWTHLYMNTRWHRLAHGTDSSTTESCYGSTTLHLPSTARRMRRRTDPISVVHTNTIFTYYTSWFLKFVSLRTTRQATIYIDS